MPNPPDAMHLEGIACNFFIFTFLKIFFTNRPLEKLFSYLYSGKGASLGGALRALQGASIIDIVHVHVDQTMLQQIAGRQ
jgi:hypothetical protein